jgi:hypothetical protein
VKNIFQTEEEAIKAGAKPEDLVFLHGRNAKEQAALELAATFGNRKQRRDRRYGRATGELSDLALGSAAADIGSHERNKRNAKRRIAKKSRKRNG